MAEAALARRSGKLRLWVTFGGFAAFGLSDSLLGPAWPAMRSQFQAPTDALGILIAATMAGLMVGSLVTGWMVKRIGLVRFLAAGTALRALGLFSLAASGQWWMVAPACFVIGLGGGAVASGSNTLLASHYGPGLMSWMHAMFGMGATLGPLLMTSTLAAGSYSLAYWLVGLVTLSLAALLAITGRDVLPAQPANGAPARPAKNGVWAILSIPAAWLGILAFFLYRGIEVTAGQWTFTLFTDARAASLDMAGISVSLYWAGLTLGRVVYGLLAGRIPTFTLLWGAVGGSLLGIALLVMVRSPSTGWIGLIILGFAMAPIFPLLTSDTPKRVGLELTALVIGLQTAIGSLGGAAIPGLAGLIGSRIGLESIGYLLAAVCLLLLLVIEQIARTRRQVENNETHTLFRPAGDNQ